MSANRDQRKQELLIRLSETRLEVIDEAEAIGASIRKSFSWLGSVGNVLMRKETGIISIAAVLGGFILARGAVRMLFSSSRTKKPAGVPADSSSSIGGILRTSLWSIVAASVVPALKQVMQQTASRKISDIAAKIFSR